MSSLSIGHSTWALLGITQQQMKEGLSGDCRRKGRFEVHILLRLFANEQVHIFHMGVECGVSLSFLVPDKPSSDNNDMAAGDVWSRVTCTQIAGSAGCVSFCLFSANWPNEISLVVWL